MSEAPEIKDLSSRMEKALAALKAEFAGLRTGRANTSLLDPIMVDAYGSKMPIAQVGTGSVPEPRMITVSVWDKALVGATEKAIRESGLGVNPVVDGQTLRLPLPPLTEERRKDLTKVAAKYAEQAKIAVRNVRRDGMDAVKKAEGVGEDDKKSLSDEIQKLTDGKVKAVDDMLSAKEEEIMQV